MEPDVTLLEFIDRHALGLALLSGWCFSTFCGAWVLVHLAKDEP